MNADDPRDKLASLQRLLLGPNAEALQRIDADNIELGAFVRLYAGPPSIADLEKRSSIREDTVVREITRLLGETEDDIHVLDACCGEASLAVRIISSIDEQVGKRISFCAVDQDWGCIRSIKARIDEFSRFKVFRHMQRQITDLADLGRDSTDCIVVNNALHEIAPHTYPEVFDSFNMLLRPTRGRVCIVDMEVLPEDAREAIAINWHGSEVQAFLEAGGMSVEMSRHPKATTVYQAHIRQIPAPINKKAMLVTIESLLRKKQIAMIRIRRKLETHLGSDVKEHKKWVVVTGTIARYADELLTIEERLKTFQPAPGATA